MTELISNQTFDEERALYNIKDTEVTDCTFAGDADGESVLKECRNYKRTLCRLLLQMQMGRLL